MRLLPTLALSLITSSVTAAACYLFLPQYLNSQTPLTKQLLYPNVSASVGTTLSTPGSFSHIFAQNAPSVLLLQVKKQTSKDFESEDPASSLEHFLRRLIPQDPPLQAPPREPRKTPKEPAESGIGSAFFIHQDGTFITNAHVIADAQSIKAITYDKQEYEVQVVGLDERTDIAVLQIHTENLKEKPTFTPVKIPAQANYSVGDWVMAIGSPFGFETSATVGIISAVARTLPDENYLPFLQTDVAINPGNSGGPLFNLQGEVIGMNTQIYSNSGGYMGVSFTLPIDYIMNIATQIQEKGHFNHGRIGAHIQMLTPSLAQALQSPVKQGVVVINVEPGSPAQKAGIQSGDVLSGVNGKQFSNPTEFVRQIAQSPLDKPVTIELYRNGQKQNISVTVLGSYIKEPPVVKTKPVVQKEEPVTKNLFDLQVEYVKASESLDLGGYAGALRIVNLSEQRNAQGLEEGDLILSINTKPIESLEEAMRMAQNIPNEQNVALLVRRNTTNRFFAFIK